MGMMARVLLGGLAWVAASSVLFGAAPQDGPVVGSAEFAASPARPMGWRGDGTGTYPGAHPPMVWSRKVADSAMTGAMCQAKKPGKADDVSGAKALELGIAKDWLILGPYACDDPEKDIEKAFVADEASLSPDENDKAGVLNWKALHTTIDTQSTHYTNEGTCAHYNVDFVYLFGRLENQVGYAHTYLFSPTGGNVQLSIHRDGAAAKMWVNGKPTTLNPKDWDHIHKSTIALEKGWNRLLVKLSCAQGSGPVGQNPWVSKWLFSAYLSAPLPAKYETKNIVWMAKLPGFSASSPAIAGEKIFVTGGTSDLACINKADGRVLWMTTCTPCDAITREEKAGADYVEKIAPLEGEIVRMNEALLKEHNAANDIHGVSAAQQKKVGELTRQKREVEKKLHLALRGLDRKRFVPMNNNEVSGANGTPCTDGQRVYVAMGGGSKGPGAYVIAAYDLEGKRLWSYHESLGAGEHGNHVSPALVDGKLIYAAMTTILAFDAPTGKMAWRYDLPRDAENYVACTFVPTRIGGEGVLITFPSGILRVSDGKMLAKAPKENYFASFSTPIIHKGFLYTDGGVFKKQFQAVQLPASAAEPARVAWTMDQKQWRMEESSGFSIASAVAFDGLYYTVDTMGVLTVIDPAARKTVAMRRMEMYQRANRMVFGFTASPTMAGGFLYIFDNTGSSLILRPGTEFKEAGRNVIENQVASAWQDYKQELFYASPVFEGSTLYLKGGEYLYCIREK